MVDMDYDVIVIGGGPGGAAAAKASVEGGLNTLLIEKKKIPRHKQCSGLILRTAAKPLRDYFGPIPEEVMAKPHDWEGTLFHLSGGREFRLVNPCQSVWRDKFDQWLCEESGAEIWDSTRLLDFAEWKDHVELLCRRDGEEIRLRSPVMIAADGVFSGVVRKIDPAFNHGLECFYYLQEHRRCDVDLEPGYFHIFLNTDLSIYPCAYIKDDILVVDSNVRKGGKVKPYRDRLLEWLRDNHGFRSHELVLTMGCREVVAPSLNRFCLGTDRVLVAGEAAGFINGFGEGISSALITGHSAGQTAAGSGSAPPGPAYRESVKPQRERTMREWYLPAIMSGKDWPETNDSLKSLSPLDRMRTTYGIFAWLAKTKGTGFQKGSLELIFRRLMHGDFNFRA